MKILAFAASNSRQSINKALVAYAASLLEQLGHQVEPLDLNDFEMPLFSVDREQAEGIPEAAQQFYASIGAADAVLISFAEHNASYSVAFKNVYDWASRIDSKVYQGKPVVMLATSPGGRGGASVLATASSSAPHFGAEIRGTLAIPRFHDNFDLDAGRLSNEELQSELASALSALVSHGE